MEPFTAFLLGMLAGGAIMAVACAAVSVAAASESPDRDLGGYIPPDEAATARVLVMRGEKPERPDVLAGRGML